MQRLFYILFFFSALAFGQESGPGFELECPIGSDTHTELISAAHLRQAASLAQSARFSITYDQVPDSVKYVMEEATKIWGGIISSRIPIKIKVSWEDLTAKTLAVTGSERVYKNFRNAPQADVWYPSALANAISGQTLNKDYFDIIIKINKNTQWKYNYQLLVEIGKFDLLSVLLHELTHGLGFVSSFDVTETDKIKWGIENLPIIYDKYLINDLDQELVNNRFFSNDSQELKKAVTEERVFFKIEQGDYGRRRPQLYTPKDFSNKGSLSHLTDRPIFVMDANDKLMYPGLSMGDRFQYPGKGIIAILFQIGWKINDYEFEHDYPEPEDLNPLTVYPNPSNEAVTMSVYGYESGKGNEYSILDIYGRTVQKGEIDGPGKTIEVNHLVPGRYFILYKGFSNPFIKL